MTLTVDTAALVAIGGLAIGVGLVAGTEAAQGIRAYLRRRRDVPSKRDDDDDLDV